MAFMNVPYALVRWAEIPRSGRVRLAGLFFISAASEGGRKMRVRRLHSSRRRMEIYPLHANGDALDATCRKMSYHRRTPAGARKRWIHDPSQGSHPILAVKLVENFVFCQRSALILVSCHVTPDLAGLAPMLALCKAASVARGRLADVASIPIMILVGVAERFAETLCLVENTFASVNVMKVFVGLARLALKLVAIAGKFNSQSCAASEGRRKRVVYI
ncbi:MAG: hypothetical protein M1830_004437 [Pleopsidium flavum]|nr:MAG: hypothetical protein M1830_004437 [Pleopsidium flavum]